MNRLVVLTVALALFHGHATTAQKAQKKPNVIFILADDLGYGDTEPYGQQKIGTPNITSLAKKGVRFTQFYAGTAVCAPSRCSFLTGLHTGHTAVRGNKTFQPEGQTPLPDSVITFPMLLQKAGYTTAAFGKWGLGFITTSGDPAKKGFGEFYGYNCQTLAHNYYPNHLWHNHDRIDLAGNVESDSVYSADLIHQQAIKFLTAKHDKPFFLYLPYTLPHADVIAPHDAVYDYYVKKFGEPAVPAPKTSDGEKHHFDAHPHAAFAAMVARLDKYVGDLLRTVKEADLEENTLVIFTSDNGPHREAGGDPDYFNSSGGLKGIKRDLYEGGIRVPFIAYQKGLTAAGSINDHPAAFWDLFPTFLGMAGVPLTGKTDGLSLLPAFAGKVKEEHDYFYWELHEAGGKQAVRMNNWKGIRLNVSKSAAPVELYDLTKDPQETSNIAIRHPDIVKKIEAIMEKAYVSNKDWPLFSSE